MAYATCAALYLMKFQSWNRFKTTDLAVEPALMGLTMSFFHSGANVKIRIPSLDRVDDNRDEDALATRGSKKVATEETIYFHIHAVDVMTDCKCELDLPESVLQKHPNAYEDIDENKRATLNAIAGNARTVASSALDYWMLLLRWVTGFHRVGRELRVGISSGWSTYLHDANTDKPVWIESVGMRRGGVHTVKVDQWQQVQSHASEKRTPPMHLVFFDDAKHCIDVGDSRRALVDLCVACEVYLRTAVLNSLPSGVLPEAIRLIEEANVNQFISHLFPALLAENARSTYKKSIKEELSSLVAKRNKLLHAAVLEGIDIKACERYRAVLESLFLLEYSSGTSVQTRAAQD